MEVSGRVLVKLSGELLGGEDGQGLAAAGIELVGREVAEARESGFRPAVVLGGGNLFRGMGPHRSDVSMDQQMADGIGMTATVMNTLALQARLRADGVPAVHMSSQASVPFARGVDPFEAQRLLDAGTVVLFSGGTGLPYFSTDMTAVMRALQVGAEALYKGTQTDGVYDRDPNAPGDTAPRMFVHADFATVVSLRLKFMDLPALALAAERRLKIVVFNAHRPGNLVKALRGQLTCSQIGPE